MTTIIGISGISGAGTTTTTMALAQAFKATALYWDDFDDISTGPDDYVDWFHKSGDYADWHYPALVQTLRELKAGRDFTHPVTGERLVATPFVFFDSSLGRMHTATAQLVDLMIHLDTSMDVALCRRLLRDYGQKTDATATDILEELDWYLKLGRPLFDATDIKNTADVVIDGNQPTKDIMHHLSEIIEKHYG